MQAGLAHHTSCNSKIFAGSGARERKKSGDAAVPCGTLEHSFSYLGVCPILHSSGGFAKITRLFLEVILGTFWRMFAVFLVRAKSQNTVYNLEIYSVSYAFGTEKVLLAIW